MAKSSKPESSKAQANAPIHIKRKRVRARLQLDKPDERLAGLRSVTVREIPSVSSVEISLTEERDGGKRHAIRSQERF